MKRSSVFHSRVLRTLAAAALVVPSVAPAMAESAIFRMIPAIPAQLTISPGTPAPAPRPAPPVARPARPAATPARIPANPPPAPTPAAPVVDQAAREANELLLKQVGDLAKQVGDLTTQMGTLTTQIGSLNTAVGELQKQLADTEGRLKGDVERTAAQPFQALQLSGAVEKGVGANIDRIFQSMWPNFAVPTALLLLLFALLGSMIVGMPVKALLYRVPIRADRTPLVDPQEA